MDRLGARQAQVNTFASQLRDEQPSLEAGCELDPNRGAGAHGSGLGPPAPEVEAQIIGHYVAITYDFAVLPGSAVCRPVQIIASVTGTTTPTARSSSTRTLPLNATVFITERTGRLVARLPWTGRAPYELRTAAYAFNGRRGRIAVTQLACPQQGCLTGKQLDPYPDQTNAEPVVPPRDTTTEKLEETIRYIVTRTPVEITDDALTPALRAFAGTRTPPAVRCLSLTACVMTYTDPSFPHHPYRLRLTISGDQVQGCWYVTAGHPIDEPPYRDAPHIPPVQAGCSDWIG
jgi:hypothetical protein